MLPIEKGLDTVTKGATSSRMRSTNLGVARMYRSSQ